VEAGEHIGIDDEKCSDLLLIYVVAFEHWCSSGLPTQIWTCSSKKHGIHKLIVIGLLATTCVEATVRFAAELGYEITVVRDATTALS
jgi:hypothetical protein